MDVVIIDDSLQMRTLLASLLRDLGCYSVRPYENVDEACVAIQIKRPSMVLCDWAMAVANGGVFLDRIRSNPNTDISSTPVIIVTGFASRDILVEAMKKGATQFLVKPVVPKELLKKMAFIMRDKREMVSKDGRMIYVQPKPRPKPKNKTKTPEVIDERDTTIVHQAPVSKAKTDSDVWEL